MGSVYSDVPSAAPQQPEVLCLCDVDRPARPLDDSAARRPPVFEDRAGAVGSEDGRSTAHGARDEGSEDANVKQGSRARSEQGAGTGASSKAKSTPGRRPASCCSSGKGPSLRGAAGRVRRGVAVRLHSLHGTPEKNGSTGLCLYKGEGDRWVVHIDGEPTGSFRNVRQRNLQVVAYGGAGKKPAAGATAQKRPREDQENRPLGREAVVQGIVELECEELRRCFGVDRNGLKRRLLLKWHPDKAPSAAHQMLATEVTQAMQSSPQWKY